MNTIKTAAISGVFAITFSCQFASAQNVGNFYTGETKVEVVRGYTGSETLPKAAKVVIQDFTVDPTAVTLDESLAGRMHTRLFLHRDPHDASVPSAVAQKVQDTFLKALIGDLKKSKIESQKSTGEQKVSTEPLLVVTGEITAIDEGNKAKRVIIGLGRGGSDVQTHIVVSSVVDGHSTVVLELRLKSQSGKKLGALESFGGSSLALNAAEGAAGDRHATVEADASRMAKGVARQIKEFMVAQHWLPAAAPAPETKTGDASATE